MYGFVANRKDNQRSFLSKIIYARIEVWLQGENFEQCPFRFPKSEEACPRSPSRN